MTDRHHGKMHHGMSSECMGSAIHAYSYRPCQCSHCRTYQSLPIHIIYNLFILRKLNEDSGRHRHRDQWESHSSTKFKPRADTCCSSHRCRRLDGRARAVPCKTLAVSWHAMSGLQQPHITAFPSSHICLGIEFKALLIKTVPHIDSSPIDERL